MKLVGRHSEMNQYVKFLYFSSYLCQENDSDLEICQLRIYAMRRESGKWSKKKVKEQDGLRNQSRMQERTLRRGIGKKQKQLPGETISRG